MSSSFFIVFLLQKPANINPDTKCQTPQNAASKAIPPNPSKKVKINNNPKPEF